MIRAPMIGLHPGYREMFDACPDIQFAVLEEPGLYYARPQDYENVEVRLALYQHSDEYLAVVVA